MYTDRYGKEHFQLGDRQRYKIYERSLKAWANLKFPDLPRVEKDIRALEKRLR
jgi:hypothetical protein